MQNVIQQQLQMPSDYICPITGELLRRPVIVCEQDHVFEEDAILQWRQTHNTCPQCRLPLVPHFILARRLMNDIEAFRNANIPPAPKRPEFKDANVKIESSTFKNKDKEYICVKVEAEDTYGRQGTDYILGIDHSGSMGSLADPDSLESLFTRMDLVYHTINTVAEMMTEQDTLSLVAFNSQAKTVMEAKQMNEEGKTYLKRILTTIKPSGQTNIYAAVSQMMAIANKAEMAGRNIVAALLTDGEETVGAPLSGTVKTLAGIQMKNPWCFSTFGFGYELNSNLLFQLSELGNGMYGFIPDVSMVGTVFINYIATSAITANRNVQLRFTQNEKDIVVNTGPLSIGHPREFVFECPVVLTTSHTSVEPTEFSKARWYYLEMISQAILQAHRNKPDNAVSLLMEVVDMFDKTNCKKTKFLLRDIQSADTSEGQIGMSPFYWKRWGSHYTYSYIRTVLQRQQRLNFKDPGSLVMGTSPLFEEILSAGEKLFVTLEPPVPSGVRQGLTQQQVMSIQSNAAQYLQTASQAAYNGGCFAGEMRVRMEDGTRKPIQTIRPGDRVWTMKGPAEVKVFVTCGSKNPQQMMSRVPGKNGETCILTPFHPYMNPKTGQWTQPRTEHGDEAMPISIVYNLVLDYGHIIEVEGVFCCTLAHGFKGDVIEHEFFGTEKVLEAMSRQPGWESGCPVYQNLQVVRNPKTNMIVDWFDDI